MHRRRVVRDATATLLRGLPLTGNRVFPFRTRPISEDELPAIRIYTPSDTIAGETFNADEEARVVVQIEVIAKALDEVENQVDDICEQVESALEGGDHNLSGACIYIAQSGTEIDYEDEDQTTMVASMRFEAIIARS